jgi:hypothetical protein
MKVLNISKTDDTPHVILDKEHGIFGISGRSLPEDSIEFYQPVLEWLTKYKTEPNDVTDFFFKLEYANTASSKMIQDILSTLETIKGVVIVWYYNEDDEDMEEMGHEYAELVEIPFEFKTY